MESESILLGQVIRNSDLFFTVNLHEDLFLSGKNRRIFMAVKSCIEKDIVPDIRSIIELDSEIDARYLSSVVNVPSAANFKYYYDNVVETAHNNELRKLALKISDMQAEKKSSSEIFAEIESTITNIRQSVSRRKIKKADEIIIDTVQEIEKRIAAKGEIPGFTSGITGLDRVLNGFVGSKLYIIGARPSQGKTAIMLNIASHIAIREKEPVGIISGESGEQELMNRIISSESMINSQSISSGYLTTAQVNDLHNACGKIHDAPIYFYDQPNPDLSDVISQCRRMVSAHGVKIIFIDYMQLIGYGDARLEKHERVGRVSLALKGLARDLNIPIVSLAQMRRDTDGRRPRLSDLSDSSQIEKDGDGIILIYHHEKDGQIDSWLLVEKNRDGTTGDVPVYFNKECVTFRGRQL